jgi:oligopeptide/dipeptide ABC transporter ATP-binding protein
VRTEEELLEIQNLTVDYRARRGKGYLRAVDDVSLTVKRGQTVGLVGESGSGKSTLGRALLGLVPIAHGEVRFEGRDITSVGRKQRRALSRDLQVVFQDPYSSLNPVKRIGDTLVEPLLVHESLDRSSARIRATEALERVGLPASTLERYPAQFSGGQRQRIAIARALIVSPRLVICDEPVSALDLSVQAQVLNLLAEIQEQQGLSYLFIAHDLAVVAYLCDEIAVLYAGRLMEIGPAEDVYRHPAHPYTRALLDAAPLPDPAAQRRRQRPARETTAATARRLRRADNPSCLFADRCPHVIEICRARRPELVAGRAACHRYQELNRE